jgi:hypothetical protein
MFLQLLSYVGIVLGFVFLTLAIASGLYYVSELVEEHTVPTKKFLARSIYAIVGLHVLLLLFDGFPWLLTIFSIFTYWVYYQNLKMFPVIDLKGPVFVSSCVLVVLNHYFWFQHFSSVQSSSPRQFPRDASTKGPSSFAEVASFFGICIWFVPFALFVSLSASDNVLPTSDYKKTDEKRRNQGLAKVIIGALRDSIYKVSRAFGYELDPNHGRII